MQVFHSAAMKSLLYDLLLDTNLIEVSLEVYHIWPYEQGPA